MKKLASILFLVLAISGCSKANVTDENWKDVDYNDAWMIIDKSDNTPIDIVFSPVLIGDFKDAKSLTIDAVVCDKEYKMCVSYQFPFTDVELEKVSYNRAKSYLN